MTTVARTIETTGLPPHELQAQVQEPVYQLFRRLFKGPRYATRDFCYSRFVDPRAHSLPVLLVEEAASRRLVGAAIFKFVPARTTYKDHPVTLLYTVLGFDPCARGSDAIKEFAVAVTLEYLRRFPGRLLCIFDLATSPVTYHRLVKSMSNFCEVYPQPDVEVPPEMQEFVQANADLVLPPATGHDQWVHTGAQPRESAEQFHARLTMGKAENAVTQYYYQRTGGVLGTGLLIIVMQPPELMDSAAEVLQTIKASVMKSPPNEKAKAAHKPARPEFKTPDVDGLDFVYLKHLRESPAASWPHFADMVQPQLCTLRNGIVHVDSLPLFAAVVTGSVAVDVCALTLVERVVFKQQSVSDAHVLVAGTDAATIGLAAILFGADAVTFAVSSSEEVASIASHELINPRVHQVSVDPNLLHAATANRSAFNVALVNCKDASQLKPVLANVAQVLAMDATAIVVARARSWNANAHVELLTSLRGTWDLAYVSCVLEACKDSVLVLLRLTRTATAACTQEFASKLQLHMAALSASLSQRQQRVEPANTLDLTSFRAVSKL